MQYAKKRGGEGGLFLNKFFQTMNNFVREISPFRKLGVKINTENIYLSKKNHY